MKLYRRFFEYIYRNLQYINDFLIISTIRQGISIYRQIFQNKQTRYTKKSLNQLDIFYLNVTINIYD
ncbi:hypothetical protein CEW46_06705 [Bacillus cereus]|nr:hypothetical protein CEW46_06705 [Bacillus cereus]